MGHHCLETLALLCQLWEARSRREMFRQTWQPPGAEVPIAWRSPRKAPSPGLGQAASSSIPTEATSGLTLSPLESPRGTLALLWSPPQGAQGPPLLQLPVCSQMKNLW